MHLFRNTYILKLFSFLSFGIIILNLANKSFYTHSHQTANGEIITHAHPFDSHHDEAPFKSHKHTSLEYLALSALDIFSITIFTFTVIECTALILVKNYALKNLVKQSYFHYKQNKSPPQLLNS